MDKDMRKLIKAAEAQGFDVELSKKGHPLFYKSGRLIATGSGSASDRRSLQNVIAPLRRAGFEWPPKR